MALKKEVHKESPHRSVLVVDDESSSLFYLNTLLNGAGYRVFSAPSVKEALNILKTKEISAVISDLVMPDRSGLELLAWINEQKIAVPFFVISGKGNISQAVSAIQAGAVDFICKPIDGKLLIEQLAKVIRDKHACTFSIDEESVSISLQFSKAQLSLNFIEEKIKEVVLNYCDQNKSAAADILKINRKTLY